MGGREVMVEAKFAPAKCPRLGLRAGEAGTPAEEPGFGRKVVLDSWGLSPLPYRRLKGPEGCTYGGQHGASSRAAWRSYPTK